MNTISVIVLIKNVQKYIIRWIDSFIILMSTSVIFDGKHDLNNFLKMLDGCRFQYDDSSPGNGILFVHA